ncbi:RNA polymerase subunit sigma-24 [Aliidiomarina shirensis]|uniref:RNA polymerase subunit sigma-24 n=1 Tax=Aliidiomarina shirensis TaxID=1048642 RepID=A0A432WXX5_9GAMM|nr:RNA polymerase sigma factor [Aliidiomarina shirensis]RUO38581.1 RNA polymerase subunit sigma-24 [Aliidiomarina shirensis]
MPLPPVSGVTAFIEKLYREQSRRILATLIRLLGSFELAEEALHDAFSVAIKQWPTQGIPENPRAWLISTGRFKAIDKLRRQERFKQLAQEHAEISEHAIVDGNENLDYIEDDSLRLIFTCCHPALSTEARVALTLREVCGLTTEEVASAFLTKPTTLAQRIVRAKRKIKNANIPYEIPQSEDIPKRLNTVLQVIYLVFNEGYSASAGEQLQRSELTNEAIRLARLLCSLMDEPEVHGLLALMLFQASRQQARIGAGGELLRLHEQDRSLWNQAMITEADVLVKAALSAKHIGVYSLQAAIAGVHATATTSAETDWREILGLYNLLLQINNSPVVTLNRAVAVGHVFGPEAALNEIEQLIVKEHLKDYYLLHSTHAYFLQELGDTKSAAASYQRALSFTEQQHERDFLERCIRELN